MKNIIFDMDGVLFDTEKLTFSIWKKIAAQYGFPGIEELYPTLIGNNYPDMVATFKAKCSGDFPFQEMIQKAYGTLRETIDRNGPPLMPYVNELLSFLHDGGYHIALASSTRTELVKKELSMAKIDHYFHRIVCGDQVTHGKPAPDIFLKACEQLGTAPEEAYVIEDSENGIRAAYAAKTRPIMVPDLVQPSPEVQKMCYRILPDLHQVKQFFLTQTEL